MKDDEPPYLMVLTSVVVVYLVQRYVGSNMM